MTYVDTMILGEITDDGATIELDGCKFIVDPSDVTTTCIWTPTADCKVERVAPDEPFPYSVTNLSTGSVVWARSDKFDEILKSAAEYDD